MATFLRLAFSVPFLGFVEEEDPLFCVCSHPGRGGSEFHFFFSQLFPLLELDGRAASLSSVLLYSTSSLGVGVVSVSIALLGENEARGLKSICAGLESPMCRFPVSHFAKVQCAELRSLRASPHLEASGAHHRSCQGAE